MTLSNNIERGKNFTLQLSKSPGTFKIRRRRNHKQKHIKKLPSMNNPPETQRIIKKNQLNNIHPNLSRNIRNHTNHQ